MPRRATGTKKAQSDHPHGAWGHGRLRLQERAVPWLYTSQRPRIIDRLRQAESDRTFPRVSYGVSTALVKPMRG